VAFALHSLQYLTPFSFTTIPAAKIGMVLVSYLLFISSVKVNELNIVKAFAFSKTKVL
jgi:hypothetical protein